MSQASSNRARNRAVLIQRDNGLSDFAGLLSDLELSVEVFGRSLPTPEQLQGAVLVIVEGRLLIESGNPNLSRWPRTFAVVDNSSKTLVSHLNRLGIAMLIRRPIHPRTLRLLLLHEIYRGPERRNRKRISIGHPIRTTRGLFKQRATLLELSPTGARVALPSAPKVGSKIALLVGKDLTKNKPLKLPGKVMRCICESGVGGRAGAEIGVAFSTPSAEAKEISAILKRFAAGPAAWNGRTPQPGQRPEVPQAAVEPTSAIGSPALESIDPEGLASRLPPSHAAPDPRPTIGIMNTPAPADLAEESFADESLDDGDAADFQIDADRRSDPRIPYDRRVVALGAEAARVLVGRDLSQGGMRIGASDSVSVGDVLRIALHCGTEIEPLIVLATAIRKDSQDGICLSFNALTDSQRERLEKIIASSGPIRAVAEELEDEFSDDEPDFEPNPVVLGEMLEMVGRRDLRSLDADDAIDRHLDSIFDTN